MITNSDLQKLRAIAMAATQPSPWRTYPGDDHGRVLVLDANDFWVADCGNAPKDAEFIATFHPECAIAMLDYIETLQREAAHHRREILRLDVVVAKLRSKSEAFSQASVVPADQEW